MKSRTGAPPGKTNVEAYRKAIAQAEAEGVAKEDMTLQLSRRDDSRLRRDPEVGDDEISFAGGHMRFLGVKVAATDAGESQLVRHGPGG